MTATFSDPKIAAKLRDIIGKQVVDILDKERPRPSYGTVQVIDNVLREADVLFPGDAAPVPVKFGAIRPTEVGQVVQVSGKSGDKWIVTIVGEGGIVDPPYTDLVAPATITLSVGVESLALQWAAVPGASGYEIQMADDAAFTVGLLTYISEGTFYYFGGLTAGITKYLRVRGTVASGVGPWSSTVSGAPSYQGGEPPAGSLTAPANFDLKGITKAAVASWDPITGVNKYEVQLATDSSFTQNLRVVYVGTTQYQFVELSPGTTYYCRVRALVSSGTGPWSVTDSAVVTWDDSEPPAGQLTAPANFDLVAAIESASARWDPIAGVNLYEVQLARNSSFTTGLVAFTTKNTQVVWTNLLVGTTYYARVRAVVSTGNGPWSAIDSAVILGQRVEPPASNIPTVTGVTLTPDIESVFGEWDPITGVTRYEVQFARNSTFTTELRSYVTSNTQFRYALVEIGVTYYMRVRVLVQDGSGPWSLTVSAAPLNINDIVTEVPTDGNPPGSSPTPTILGAIGFLHVKWTKIANNDLVTYEVHASTVSGFTAGASTKVGETESSFMDINKMPNGDALSYTANTYVRIIAKDKDGAATQSSQASGKPVKVETGDVGQIDPTHIYDGVVPQGTPPTPVLTPGPKFFYAKWDFIANADPTVYEVHVHTNSTFTPSANTKVLETSSNFCFIKTRGAGTGYTELAYGVTYYVRIWPKDVDGYGTMPTVSQQASGQVSQINTPDIAVGSITAASAIVADAAIGNAKISDLNATKIIAGTLDAQLVNVINLNASNIVTGSMHGQYVTVGTLDVTSAEIRNLEVGKVLGGTFVASEFIIPNTTAAAIRSAGFVTGDAGSGFRLRGTGVAELNQVTVRGTVISKDGFKTAISGKRIEITSTLGYGELVFIKSNETTGAQIGIDASGMVLAVPSGHNVKLQNSFLSTNVATVDFALATTTVLKLISNTSIEALDLGAVYIGKDPAATLLGLKAGTNEWQSRPGYSTASYLGMAASAFRVASSQGWKDEVRPADAALEKIKSTSVYKYKRKWNDSNLQVVQSEVDETGFIVEEIPQEYRRGDGYLINELLAVLWKGVQELNNKVDALPGPPR